MTIKDFTRFRRRNPTRCPEQQLLADFRFQGRQLLAQSRLSHMQHICSLRETANIDDFDEILQPLDIHYTL